MEKKLELKFGKHNGREFEMITMCSECCAIKYEDGTWMDISDDPSRWDELANKYADPRSDKRISHGACPESYERMMNEIRKLKN